MDDGTFPLSDALGLSFAKSQFYKTPVLGRDMHLQLPGEMQAVSIGAGSSGDVVTAKLRPPVPVWEGMRSAPLDLNAKRLRVAGGCVYKP